MQPSLPSPQLPPTESASPSPHVEASALMSNQPVAVTAPAQDPATLDNPTVAADEDVLEKEWVQRLKHIISTTKHDPFKQEHEISKLQADYLRKRYGKEVRIPADE